MSTTNTAAVSLCLFLTTFMMIFFGQNASADGICTNLAPVSPYPTARNLNSIAVGDETVVAVGDRGTVITASEFEDELNWKKTTTQTTADLNDVIHTGTSFVAAGATGTILVSDDSRTWERSTVASGASFHGLASDGTRIVVVGEGGIIFNSSDLQVWTAAHGSTSQNLEAVAWDGRSFVAVGNAGTIVASADGFAWTRLETQTNRRFTGIACHAETCVAVTEDAFIFSRNDSSQWTNLGRAIWSAHSLDSVRWAADRFVAVGADGSQGASFDGVEWWMTGSGLESTSMQDVIAGGGRLIAVGRGGQIVASGDQGTSWTTSNAMADVTLRGGTRGNGKYVVVGGNFARFGQGHILTSDDRRNWDLRFHVGYETVYDIAHGAGRFIGLWYRQEVAGGWDFINSFDGESWQRVGASFEGQAPTFANDLEFSAGRFLLAGSKATIGTSTDGNHWRFSSLENYASGSFSGVTSNGSVIVAVGHATDPEIFGMVATSTDGVNLTRRNVNPAPELNDVAWGAGRFVTVGAGGWIMTSPTGIGWTRATSPTAETLITIRWLGSGFVAAGENGAVLSSPNGISWKRVESHTDSTIHDVFGSASDYFVAGDHGLLLRAHCVPQARIPSPPGL